MKIYNKILCVGLLFGVLSSCDDYDGTDTLPDTRPVATTATTSITLKEGGAAKTITVNLSALTTQVSEYRVELVNASMLDSDLHVTDLGEISCGNPPCDGYQFDIPSLTDTMSFNLEALINEEIGQNQEFTLRITPNRGEHGAAENEALLIDVTVLNTYYYDLTYAWDNGDVTIPQGTFPVCPNTDVDVYVATADGFDIDNPWPNEIGNVDAATGDCPEHMGLRGLADGDYVIFAELWGNAFAGAGATDSFAITTTVLNNSDNSSTDVVQSAANAFNADSPAGSLGIVGYISVNGAVMTFSN